MKFIAFYYFGIRMGNHVEEKIDDMLHDAVFYFR